MTKYKTNVMANKEGNIYIYIQVNVCVNFKDKNIQWNW